MSKVPGVPWSAIHGVQLSKKTSVWGAYSACGIWGAYSAYSACGVWGAYSACGVCDLQRHTLIF